MQSTLLKGVLGLEINEVIRGITTMLIIYDGLLYCNTNIKKILKNLIVFLRSRMEKTGLSIYNIQ